MPYSHKLHTRDRITQVEEGRGGGGGGGVSGGDGTLLNLTRHGVNEARQLACF